MIKRYIKKNNAELWIQKYEELVKFIEINTIHNERECIFCYNEQNICIQLITEPSDNGGYIDYEICMYDGYDWIVLKCVEFSEKDLVNVEAFRSKVLSLISSLKSLMLENGCK